MLKSSLLFIILLLSACSRVSVVNNTNRPITFNPRAGHSEKVDILIQKNFYLWGLLPGQHEIDVGEILKEKGQKSASSLIVKKENFFTSYFWPFVSFGIYIPKSFRVKFNGQY